MCWGVFFFFPIFFSEAKAIVRFSVIRGEGHCHMCRSFSLGSSHPGQCVPSFVHCRMWPVGSQSCMILHVFVRIVVESFRRTFPTDSQWIESKTLSV